MVKLRMNTVDVAAEVKCLRKLIGMRCANIYDLSAKTYVFKLMKSSGITESGESEKVLLLLESGVRFHMTEFSRDKSTTPSGFTLKLRKHIRTRRLEDVRQLGIDRVVDFHFGLGEGAHHIILELYSQGNILLADADYNVLTLLRTHRDDEKGLMMMPRHQYPVNLCRQWERTSLEKLKTEFINCKILGDNQCSGEAGKIFSSLDSKANGQTAIKANRKGKENQGIPNRGKKGDGGGKSSDGNLKNALGEILGFGPTLSEHLLLDAGLEPNMNVFHEYEGKFILSLTEDQMKSLHSAIAQLEDWLQDIIVGDQIPEGYILMEGKDSRKRQSLIHGQEQSKVYGDFSALLLNQFDSQESMRFESFDACMDEFFSKIEGQRAEQQQKMQKESAFLKLEKIHKDQVSRVEALKKEVQHCVQMAGLIEYNLEDVDAAILAVRTTLASGMDWKDVARMVKEEKKAGNPVAGLIHSLQLEKNQVTLLLSNNLDEMDDEEKTQPVEKVEVDLALSAHANACWWFEMKKKQASKQDKTVAAHEKAFKAAERRTHQQLAQAKTVASISHIRKVHWFEKFNWFISSENYLVISGRDAQQNELLVKRYMRNGDLYVHADLHGASSTIVKNHERDCPIPPLTLNQAGCFTVCRSQAWDSKIVTSAWWVYANQVSKTAPTGEYLTAGSFMIRGKKNFLPPHSLVMGFGILFRVDESCIAAHLNERKRRGKGEDDSIESEELLGEISGSNADDLNATVTECLNSAQQTLHTGEVDDSQTAKGIGSSSSSSEEDDALEVADTTSRRSFLLEERMDLSQYNVRNDNDELSTNVVESWNFTSLEELMDKALELSSQRKLYKGGKYDYDAHPSTVEGEWHDNRELLGQAIKRERPYLSKAERRKLKKGLKDVASLRGGNIVCDTEQLSGDKLSETQLEEAMSNRDQSKSESAVYGRIPRGQRGRLKKMKEKYAEQDEEERKLWMALLGSTGKMNSKNSRELTSKDATATVGKLAKGSSVDKSDQVPGGKEVPNVDSSKVCYKCKKSGHIAQDCPVARSGLHNIQEEEFIASNDKIVAHKADEVDKLDFLIEENILELGDEERGKLTELDSLTGCPLSDDIMLYAVPVCGPYSALQGYKYHVKLTPGTSKRGKASKNATSVFVHAQDATPRERELIKAITEPELVAAIISNAKVTAPGLTQLKRQQKKVRKMSTIED